MKNKKTELERMKRLLEQDRVTTGDTFKELLQTDLIKLLGDYFEFNNGITTEIYKNNDKISVQITFFADRIKSFGYAPNTNE